jgi:hypothetical protein
MAVIVSLAGPATAGADFKLIQNTATGRVTAGAAVACTAPGGFTHWDVRDISWTHNTANQGAGKDQALKNAMASWTNVPNASHQLNYDGTTGAGFATDGVNAISWGTTSCSGCLALTALVLQSGQRIIESDIIFINSFTWTTNGSQYDTESVAAHELGHSLGLHHPNTVSGPETMSTPYFGSGMRSLHADDMAGLQCSENRYPAVCTGNPPPRPLTASVSTAYCFGNNGATWASSVPCTPTRYEVWGATNADFSNQYLIYSGTATSTPVPVTQSQVKVFVRVRACNGALCGFYRWAGQAIYYPGCCITPPC